MQFKLNRDENSKLLTNDVKNITIKLIVLNSRNNKLHYSYST